MILQIIVFYRNCAFKQIQSGSVSIFLYTILLHVNISLCYTINICLLYEYAPVTISVYACVYFRYIKKIKDNMIQHLVFIIAAPPMKSFPNAWDLSFLGLNNPDFYYIIMTGRQLIRLSFISWRLNTGNTKVAHQKCTNAHPPTLWTEAV